MSKPGPKTKLTQTHHAGVYKADSVKDVAESLGITNLPDAVASALASDVEYRIHQVIEEAARYMRHARRTVLTTADIDLALRTLNIEPLYGHTPHAPSTFRRALPFPHLVSAGAVYFVEDEEIDFDRVLREEKIIVPRGVNWIAHWLAVEGVQPLVPENPPAVPREEPTPAGAEIQIITIWCSRVYAGKTTTSNTSKPACQTNIAKRTAALASLRADAGLQALLPYLVRWIGEGVVNVLREGTEGELEGKALEVLLDAVGAILANTTLFIEPYLHQILPAILVYAPTFQPTTNPCDPPSHDGCSNAWPIVDAALDDISVAFATYHEDSLGRTFSASSAEPRGTPKSLGTREGAIRGLVGIGKEAVRKGVLEGGGARVIGEECATAGGDGVSGVVDAVMIALQTLSPTSDMPEPLDRTRDEDIKLIAQLNDILGEFFTEKILGHGDRTWVTGIVHSLHS
ncbi:TATA box binding protein associated factor-domain-containing protein [Butyriboletus roseoflavus]|nr:TATA box binding protein associated factor-domain-containing protein [Butyriboletus roseoflavus]